MNYCKDVGRRLALLLSFLAPPKMMTQVPPTHKKDHLTATFGELCLCLVSLVTFPWCCFHKNSLENPSSLSIVFYES